MNNLLKYIDPSGHFWIVVGPEIYEEKFGFFNMFTRETINFSNTKYYAVKQTTMDSFNIGGGSLIPFVDDYLVDTYYLTNVPSQMLSLYEPVSGTSYDEDFNLIDVIFGSAKDTAKDVAVEKIVKTLEKKGYEELSELIPVIGGLNTAFDFVVTYETHMKITDKDKIIWEFIEKGQLPTEFDTLDDAEFQMYGLELLVITNSWYFTDDLGDLGTFYEIDKKLSNVKDSQRSIDNMIRNYMKIIGYLHPLYRDEVHVNNLKLYFSDYQSRLDMIDNYLENFK